MLPLSRRDWHTMELPFEKVLSERVQKGGFRVQFSLYKIASEFQF